MQATEEVVVEGAGVFNILDESGDARFQWDPNDPAQVAKAEAKFEELKSKRYLLYKVNKKGDKGEVLHAFDPTAERIIAHTVMVGG